MNFIVDNALSPVISREPRAAGYDAVHVLDYGMAAASDADILARAVAEQRIVISADTDFGTLAIVGGPNVASIILFRRETNRRPGAQVMLLLNHLDGLAAVLEAGCIVVFDQGRVRIRMLAR